MCGIFGVISPSGVSDRQRTQFEQLSRRLAHRGPDGSGLIEDARALIGMHRLSIVDVENGDQPFSDERHMIHAVENGEIYNAQEIRDQFIAQGHSFHSRSDAEIIPHVVEVWGIEGVARLRGMFAIAVLDLQQGVVHLVRDRLGEKPLYVHRSGGIVWFSSELRAMVQSGCVPPSLEANRVASYLLHGFIPEGPAFCETQVVEPGTILTIDMTDGSAKTTDYWRPWYYLGANDPSTSELADILEDAVSAACLSDVPVGVALSGGLDSAAVAAIAAKRVSNLQAFTVGYDTPSATDETRAAERIAQFLGIDHHTVTVRTADVGRSYREVTIARDEPIADIAGPSYFALAQAFREFDTPVLLSGQGGDELFWGYPWVREAAQMSATGLAPIQSSPASYLQSVSASRSATAEAIRSLGGIRTQRRMRRLERESLSSEVRIPLYPSSPGYSLLRRRIQAIMPTHRIEHPYLRYPLPLEIESTSLFAVAILETYLRTNGLTQLDRLTMHHSVEARTPLVDHRLVEYVLRTQGHGAKSVNDGKDRLRDAVRLLVPELPANGRKQGFTPPIRAWMREIWLQERSSLVDPSLAETHLFDPRLLRKALASPFMRFGEVDMLAFRLLTLELWWRDLAR